MKKKNHLSAPFLLFVEHVQFLGPFALAFPFLLHLSLVVLLYTEDFFGILFLAQVPTEITQELNWQIILCWLVQL